MSEMTGKVALVTGGASGIGEAAARWFSRQGAHVAVADFNIGAATDVAERLSASGPRAIAVQVDVSQALQVEAMVQQTVAAFGRLDALVNSAGISSLQAPTADYPLEAWDRVIGVNLSGTFYAMKYAIPAMLANGGGAIVNIASMMGHIAHPNGTGYVTSKHGVVGLTKATALDYARQGIRVNAIGPGLIDTAMTRTSIGDPDVRAAQLGMCPLGRFAEPEEMAELIGFLCSPRASYTTGAFYLADGGFTLG